MRLTFFFPLVPLSKIVNKVLKQICGLVGVTSYNLKLTKLTGCSTEIERILNQRKYLIIAVHIQGYRIKL